MCGRKIEIKRIIEFALTNFIALISISKRYMYTVLHDGMWRITNATKNDYGRQIDTHWKVYWKQCTMSRERRGVMVTAVAPCHSFLPTSSNEQHRKCR